MATGGFISIEKHSDELFDFQCTMCKHKDRNKEAEKYCVECNDYYCLSCVKVHEDVPSLTGHNILNKSQFQQESNKALPLAPTERCEKHRHKLVDMYCRNHDEVCCAICLAAEHKLCHDIFYIPEYVQNNQDSLQIAGFENNLKSAVKSLTDCLDTYQEKKQQLPTRKTNLIERIKHFRKETNNRLDELEANSLSDTDNEIKGLTEKLEEKIEQLKSDKAKIMSAKDNIAAAGNNVSQVFVSCKIASKVANKAENTDKGDKTEADLPTFRGDVRVMSLLQEMNNLGIIQKQDTAETKGKVKGKVPRNVSPQLKDTCKVNTELSTSSNEITEQTTKSTKRLQKSRLLQVKGRTTVCTKVESDSKKIDQQFITSCCIVKDGKIVVCDHDNKKLKFLHRSAYNVTNQCNLSGFPWQVCPYGDRSVAVSLGKTEEVQFFPVFDDKTTEMIQTLKTDHYCYGLAYSGDNLYISDRDTSIYIYDIFGRKLKHFRNDLLRGASLLGTWLGLSLKSLAVSADGSSIYASHTTKGLILLDNDGQVVKSYNRQNLQTAFGCHCLSGNKDLLVCGMGSNNVLQFGPNCELVGEVLKSDGGHAYKIVCCDQQMSKMVVCRSDTYYIDIYDLQ